MEDFNHPDICWSDYTARRKQPRRFLKSVNDNFPTQVIEEPIRRGIWLNLMLTKKGSSGM